MVANIFFTKITPAKALKTTEVKNLQVEKGRTGEVAEDREGGQAREGRKERKGKNT